MSEANKFLSFCGILDCPIDCFNRLCLTLLLRLNGTKFHGYRERLCVKFANPNGSGMTTNSMTSDALTCNAASNCLGGGGATAAVGCELKVGNKRPFSAEDKYLQSTKVS